MSQTEMVLLYLEKNGSIDPLRAFTELGIMRLAARIADLKRSGHDIVTEIKTRQMPNGTTKSWAEYKKSRSPVDQTGERQGDGVMEDRSTSENTTD